MTILQQLRQMLTELLSLLRSLPDEIERWLLRQHAPFDVAGDGTGPAVCLPCRAPWPCAQTIGTWKRLDSRR